jgi:hypothetical protein
MSSCKQPIPTAAIKMASSAAGQQEEHTTIVTHPYHRHFGKGKRSAVLCCNPHLVMLEAQDGLHAAVMNPNLGAHNALPDYQRPIRLKMSCSNRQIEALVLPVEMLTGG